MVDYRDREARDTSLAKVKIEIPPEVKATFDRLDKVADTNAEGFEPCGAGEYSLYKVLKDIMQNANTERTIINQILMDADKHAQVDILTSVLPIGAATEATLAALNSKTPASPASNETLIAIRDRLWDIRQTALYSNLLAQINLQRFLGSDISLSNPILTRLSDGTGGLTSTLRDMARSLDVEVKTPAVAYDISNDLLKYDLKKIGGKEPYSTPTLASKTLETSNGDSTSTPIDIGIYKEANFFFDITTITGTAPAITFDILTQDPISLKWLTLLSYPTLSEVGTILSIRSSNLGFRIAAKWMIAGTFGIGQGISFTLGAVLKI